MIRPSMIRPPMIRQRGARLLRPPGFDELGLRRAISDRMLPFLVAAMGFLAALALSGWVGAAELANSWQEGAASVLTVQVPQPNEPALGGGTRASRVLAALRAAPSVAQARSSVQPSWHDCFAPGSGRPQTARQSRCPR